MGFSVEPRDMRTFATELNEAHHAAEAAKKYVNQHGNFSLHESGLMGMIAPGHRNLVAELNTLLQHLSELASASEAAMKQSAQRYEHTDERAAATIDESYPVVPRPRPSRD
jgi:uncharacterized protein YukE